MRKAGQRRLRSEEKNIYGREGREEDREARLFNTRFLIALIEK